MTPSPDYLKGKAEGRAEALEEAARLIEQTVPAFGATSITLDPRPVGDRSALAYATAIRALKNVTK